MATLYDAPTFKRYDDSAEQWLEWKRQAYALPVAEVQRHASVSRNNRHACTDCFCCACVEVSGELKAGYRIVRSFSPADRYLYDFRLCTYDKGWAQLDTGQDASYFGQWINVERQEIFCYCEGDLILTRCVAPIDLVAAVQRIKTWNEEQGHKFLGIDPGLGEEMRVKLVAAGLGGYLH